MEDFHKYQKIAQAVVRDNYRQQKDYPKALAVFKETIGDVLTKDGRPPPKDKQGWAFRSLNVRKEKAQLMEEMAASDSTASKLALWGAAVQEWVAIAKTFAPRLEPLRQNLAPQDESRKVFVGLLKTPREEKEFCLLELAWLGHQHGEFLDQAGKKAAAEAQAIAGKRELYFELYFEQKRCSVMAFKDLGTKATQGNAVKLQEKFAGFAKDFVELQSKTKNPDLSQTIKDRIKELVESVDELKKEYKQLTAK